eukprot:TRINITY_DN102474_c0_g1_i1.p1 TRINITY_DN102474_c0_g1~~TRINITY_DN102474_c0_g1_i1.p1  ORF type:complete len:317 (+),score=28.13 TRINITY_DN102474_c0_g1_i1:69-1019(+)
MTQDATNEGPDVVVDHAHRYLLLLALAAAAVVPATSFVLAVWRRGLLDVLSVRASILDRPLVFSLKRAVKRVKRRIAHFLRVAMLLLLNLSEDEREEVLQGLSPEVHDRLFRRPLRDLIPRPLRRLLLGPVPAEEPERELSPADEGDLIEQPSAEFGRQWSQASTVDDEASPSFIQPPVQRILARWTVGRYVQFVGSGCLEQVSFRVRKRLQPPRRIVAGHAGKVSGARLKPWVMSVAPWVARAVLVAAVSGSSCALIGSVAGAAVGLLLALPTLGLSIPIGAVIGCIFCGCFGLLLGLTAVAIVATRSERSRKAD